MDIKSPQRVGSTYSSSSPLPFNTVSPGNDPRSGCASALTQLGQRAEFNARDRACHQPRVVGHSTHPLKGVGTFQGTGLAVVATSMRPGNGSRQRVGPRHARLRLRVAPVPASPPLTQPAAEPLGIRRTGREKRQSPSTLLANAGPRRPRPPQDEQEKREFKEVSKGYLFTEDQQFRQIIC